MKYIVAIVLLCSMQVHAITTITTRTSIPTVKSNQSLSFKFGSVGNATPYAGVQNEQSKTATYAAIAPPTPKYIPIEQLNTARKQYNDNPYFKSAKNDSHGYTERQDYYRRNPQNVTIHNQNGGNDFGLLSGFFLASMLNNAAQAATYDHNHSADPDYLAWKAQATAQAANDANLKNKLDAMQAGSAAITTPSNPTWLPDGVSPAVALSDIALKSSQPDFTVCVGGTDGAYYKVAQQVLLPAVSEFLNIVPVATKGSPDAIKKLDAKQCNAAFVQGDSVYDETGYTTVFEPFLEVVHLVCSKNLKAQTRNVYIASGSSTLTTIKALQPYSQTLKEITIIPALSNTDALASTLKNSACMAYVAAPHSSPLTAMFEKQKNLELVGISDIKSTDLDNSKYTIRTLSSSDYPQEISHGWVTDHYLRTVAIPAKFIVSNAWSSTNYDLSDKLNLQLVSLQQSLKEAIDQK